MMSLPSFYANGLHPQTIDTMLCCLNRPHGCELETQADIYKGYLSLSNEKCTWHNITESIDDAGGNCAILFLGTHIGEGGITL